MEPLSPIMPIAGGLLIGLAAALLLLLNGRIAGISGLAAIATRIASEGAPWQQAMAFVVGLPLGTATVALLKGQPVITVSSSLPLLISAGILVGVGTRLGNGCTSGHGVCGIARLSPRSIVATLVFIASAALTVFVARHMLGG